MSLSVHLSLSAPEQPGAMVAEEVTCRLFMFVLAEMMGLLLGLNSSLSMRVTGGHNIIICFLCAVIALIHVDFAIVFC